MKNLMKLKEWQALVHHQGEIAGQHMRDWFAKDKERFSRFHLKSGEILLDYSRNRISNQTIELLCDLAYAVELPKKIELLFSGNPINSTENRPALHTAVRNPHHPAIQVNGENTGELIAKAQEKMQSFVTAVHNEKVTGTTGKPIRHIINIGIGGSHLGPMMCTHALKEFAVKNLDIHYISSVGDKQINEVLQKIDAEAALFIVSSKSFTTIETLTNAHTIATWLKTKCGPDAVKKQFLAITACPQHAIEFGIAEHNIFPLWEWIGGRYSIWSTIGLPLMLIVGNQRFSEFLAGAHAMDEHFRNSEFHQNMPVLMALFNVWNLNFFGATAQALVPYDHRLRFLIPYLQQAEMESNGKRTDLDGNFIDYSTGPILFGEEGCDGQHTYHQLLHQGQHLIPVDFIMTGNAGMDVNLTHQNILVASGLSQAQALMRGKTYEESYQELLAANYSPQQAEKLAPHQVIPGNKPSNVLFLDRVNPKNLGALIALYEHRIFVQSVIWDINAFDQWGVELGKQLLPTILKHVQNDKNADEIDSATAGLIHHFKSVRGDS